MIVSKTGRGLLALAATFLIAVAVIVGLAAADAADRPKLLVFNTVLIDSLMTGEGGAVASPEEKSQVQHTADALRENMAKTGRYQVLPGPENGSPDIDLTCADCIVKEARAAGADFVLTSAVSRISATVAVLTVELDDIANQKAMAGGKIELRGIDPAALRGAAAFAVEKYFSPAGPPPGDPEKSAK